MYVGPALLALVEGEDPEAVVPFYALRAKCRRVAGTYESFRSAATANIEPADGSLDVTLSTALGEETLTAFPETTARDDYQFYTVSEGGDRVPLTFEPTDDDGLDCYYRRWRLHETDG